MQQSLSLPRHDQVPRPWERWHAGLSRLTARLADPTQRPDLLWQIAWVPYWAWSDCPVPSRPVREGAVPADIGPAGQAVVSGIDRVRRRLWLSHAAAAIFRGLWLGILAAALLMLLDLLGGPIFDPRPAIAIGAVLLAAGLGLAILSRPSRAQTARMLDRSFGLHERLTTAIDDLGLGVPAEGERARVVYLQMADAANAMAVLRNDRRLRPAVPVREVVLAVLFALILATLAFLRGLGGGLPELAAARVPEFTPAVEQPAEPEPSAAEVEASTMAPTVQEVLERADRSARARRDLQVLANALADHAVTRPAAEQIAQGDYAAAGDDLREAAAQAGDLSQGARETLASDLQRAANQMEPETSGLQEASSDAATGLRTGAEPAQREMGDLAEAVERAGEQVVPQGELASQMRNAQQSSGSSGESGSRDAAQPGDGSAGEAASQFSPAADPGSGIDAATSTGEGQPGESGDPSAQSGANPQQAGGEQPGSSGQPGAASAPGEGEQGEGGSGAPGEASQSGSSAAGPEGEGDSAVAQQGAGAGTGESAEMPGSEAAAASTGNQAASGEEEPAPPQVSVGGDEADPEALGGANEQVALPSGSGEEGVQTASDGGSALRGSGAGVTAGSGYAVQGEVGEAGPDSNRVPPQHRDTVERYFSNEAVE